MGKTLRQIEQDIKAGREINENFIELKVGLSSVYFSLAGIEMAMNYYSHSEKENEKTEDDGANPSMKGRLSGLDDLNRQLVGYINAVFAGQISEKLGKEIKLFRKDIIFLTKAILSYADTFALYEYCLDRILPSFEGDIKDIDNEETARKLLTEMFGGNDNFEINENVKLMVRMLPVRMTKNKFFDICHEALAAYIGAPRDSFDKMLYFIRSAAGLFDFSDTDERLETLYRFYKDVESKGFSDLTKDEAGLLADRLKGVVRKSINSVEALRRFEEIANELLVLCHTMQCADESSKAEFFARKSVFDEAMAFYAMDSEPEMSDKVKYVFENMEGKLEYYIEMMQKYESLLDDISGFDSIKGVPYLKVLEECRKLMSTSLFVELDEEPDGTPLSEETYEKQFEVLKAQLEDSSKKNSRMLFRAKMAFTLSQLPVFFKNRTEVMNYMLSSLDSCSDKAEKLASVRCFIDALEETGNEL
ncbi:MAG: hypothetical protein ILP10_05795 [Lachnospiraceae bacterium]|nr:hypothetical protein [Lachnospiraceae bacterium]